MALSVGELTATLRLKDEMSATVKKAQASVAAVAKDMSGKFDSVGQHVSLTNRYIQQFAGGDTIARATAMTQAVSSLGGVTKLTAQEQATLNATLKDGMAKMSALGQTAPANMRAYANETAKASDQTSKLGGFMSGLGGQIKAMMLGFIGAQAVIGLIMRLVSGLGEFVAVGVKLPGVQRSFNKLAEGLGVDAGRMVKSMRIATEGLVSDFDLMQSSNKAMLLGLPVTATEMSKLARTATVLGRAMGQDATTSLDDLIKALGRSSPMILDNLGLTVKVGEANEKYAALLGKTSEELTDAEKKMAFYTEALRKADEKVAEIGEQTATLGEVMKSAWTSIGNVVSAAAAKINTDGVGAIMNADKHSFMLLTSIGKLTSGVKFLADAFRDVTASIPLVESADLAKVFNLAEREARALTLSSFELDQIYKALDDEQKRIQKSADEAAKAFEKTKDAAEKLFNEVEKLITPGHGLAALPGTLEQVAYAEQRLADQMALHALQVELSGKLHQQTADQLRIDFIPALLQVGETYDIVGIHAAEFGEDVDETALTLSKLSSSFEQLANIAGDSMSETVRWLGTLVKATEMAWDAGKSLKAAWNAGDWAGVGMAGMQGAAAIAQATSGPSRAGNIMGGAASGAAMGTAIFPGVGTAIGAGVGALVGAFRKTATEKAAQEATRAANAMIGDLKAQVAAFYGSTAKAEEIATRLGINFKNIWNNQNVQGLAYVQQQMALLTEAMAEQARMAETLGQTFVDRLGVEASGAIQPLLDKLAALGALTPALQEELMGMAGPDFKAMEEAAARYGLSQEALGDGYWQAKLDDQFMQVIRDYELLTQSGADAGAVLNAMGPSVSEMVQQAIKYGAELPASMKPIVESLTEANLLVDENGVKLEGLEGLTFAETLTQGIDRVVLKLNELIFALTGELPKGLEEVTEAAEVLGTTDLAEPAKELIETLNDDALEAIDDVTEAADDLNDTKMLESAEDLAEALNRDVMTALEHTADAAEDLDETGMVSSAEDLTDTLNHEVMTALAEAKIKAAELDQTTMTASADELTTALNDEVLEALKGIMWTADRFGNMTYRPRIEWEVADIEPPAGATFPSAATGATVLKGGLVNVHAGEEIVPASQVGRGTTIVIQAWDGPSVDRWLRNGGARKIAEATFPIVPSVAERYGVA